MTGRDLPSDLEIEHNWEKHYELQPNDVFVEVGGFWGRYASYASKRCKHIVMLEPNPANLERLTARVNNEQLSNVTVLPVAISDYRATAIFVNAGNPAGTRLAVQGEDISSFEKVTVETYTLESILDSVNIDCVGLLAADCEGCEVPLVQNAGRWLTERLVKHWAIGAYHHPDNSLIIRI